MNVQLGRGGKVHYSTTPEGFMPGPDCGGNRAVEGYRKVTAEVNCKNCIKIMAAPAAETEGEIMAKNTQNAETVEVDESLADALGDAPEQSPEEATMAQIQANIERARSLAEAENTEGLAELDKETKALISSLPRGGKTPDGKTWAGFKAKAGQDFRQAAAAQPKTDGPSKAVATKAEAAPDVTTDYTMTEGVKEIVDKGAALVREGVQLHVKGAQTARAIAGMLLDTRRRIVTKDGVPDLKAHTQAARNASTDMYAAAEKVLAEESGDTEHAKALVRKLSQAVRNQMSDVLVGYVKELDTASEEWAEHYGAVAKAHPELTPSEAVFKFYDINPVSRRELAAQRQAERSTKLAELEAAAKSGDAEAAEEAEELKAKTVQERIAGDIQTAEKALKAAVKAAAELSDEDKNALKAKAAELLALLASL
jgi:hypothetical protein